MSTAKKRHDRAALLERGRRLSAELYQAAISAVCNSAEATGEDAEPTIRAITVRYEALVAAAEAVVDPEPALPVQKAA